MPDVSSCKVEENHCRIRATKGEVYICSSRKELGPEGASRCYIWDGDWVITHMPRDKPYGRQDDRCVLRSVNSAHVRNIDGLNCSCIEYWSVDSIYACGI
jgi:hypothetical protein